MTKKLTLMVMMAATVALATPRAHADEYAWGYTFDDGTDVAGCLTADLDAGYLTNITDVTFTINGGTEIVPDHIGKISEWNIPGAPTIALDGSDLDLIFYNNTTGYFLLADDNSSWGDNSAVWDAGLSTPTTDDPNNGSFFIGVKGATPASGGTLAMLALGLCAIRRMQIKGRDR
jgi:hypothetical protein